MFFKHFILGVGYSTGPANRCTSNLHLAPVLCSTLQATHWRARHDHNDLHNIFGNCRGRRITQIGRSDLGDRHGKSRVTLL